MFDEPICLNVIFACWVIIHAIIVICWLFSCADPEGRTGGPDPPPPPPLENYNNIGNIGFLSNTGLTVGPDEIGIMWHFVKVNTFCLL